MPGLGTITQRSDGESFTASKYNSDRQELVNMMEPQQIDDYEANVTQSNIQTDPGESGGEDLATSLAALIERLKYRIAEITGASLWRTSYVTRKSVALTVTAQATENAVWTPTGTTVWNIRFRVPEGFLAASDAVLKIFRRHTVSGGTAVMRYTFTRYRDATAATTSGSGNIDFPHVDGNSHVLSITLAQATVSYQLGDTMAVSITRLGDDAGDTNTGTVLLDGFWLEYSGIGGR